MNPGEGAADQVVKMSLKALEIAAKLSGPVAKNLATYLYAVLNSKEKTHSKTRLKKMLKSGKPLKVFSINTRDLKLFTEEARKYGILYCALKDKGDVDGRCDIMVRAEDAPKINRIAERFHLSTVDSATISTKIQKNKAEKAVQENTPNKTSAIMEDLFVGGKENLDPQYRMAEPDVPSKNNLANTKTIMDSTNERKSVRAELFEIKQTQEIDSVDRQPNKYKQKDIVKIKQSATRTSSKPKRINLKERQDNQYG